MSEFTSFPIPVHRDDKPLVTHAGFDYLCSGCGDHVPDGVWIREFVKDGQIIGLTMRNGRDGEIIHQCGQVD